MTTLSPVVLLDAVRRAKLQRSAENSLMEFCKQAWSIIEPQQEFKDNWHLHVIAEHLEAISKHEIRDLLINIPPGCMKSILVSVMWPSWEWARNASLRYLGTSYGEDLALRDSQKCRDIIVSDWYRNNWPQVEIKKGEDQKIKYALTSGGWRMASSVGGRATGEHPDRIIVDDPHSALQAQSEAERGRALEWFDGTISTRGVSRGVSKVIVMQRLHEKDMSGHVLEDIGGYEHLCLPMKFESKAKTRSKKDPRTKEGELLWPALFSAETVTTLEKRLGEYGAAGQLQQQPNPPGGGILKTAHFRMWAKSREIPRFSFVLQSYDCAFTEKTSGDPSACTVWGVFSIDGKQGAMLLDAWAERLSYPDLRQRVLDEWSSVYGETSEREGVRADLVLVEKKASGQSLLQDLRMANVPARDYTPVIDKIARAHQVAPMLELDCLWIPESSKDKGEFVKWARPFLTQVEKFPNAEHDDFVDTLTQAMLYLRNAGLLQLEVAEEEETTEVEYKKKQGNPYAC